MAHLCTRSREREARVRHRVEPRTNPFTAYHEDGCWSFYGNGSDGAKADELYLKREIATKAGFVEIPRRVLRMDLFDSFRARNDIDRHIEAVEQTRAVRNLVIYSPFNRYEMEFFEGILKQLPCMVPLVIRSSAHGDAAGTGFYDSTFFMKTGNSKIDIQNFIGAVKKVLASEFSAKAWLFRERKGLEPGMAIIIEEAFVRDFVGGPLEANRYFGPDLSGFAYTSADHYEEGLLGVVVGLPTRAVNGGAMLVPGYWNMTLERYRYQRNDFGQTDAELFDCEIGRICVEDIPFGPQNTVRLREAIGNSLQELERLAGRRQYIEWAVREVGGRTQRALLQIADAVPSEDSAILPLDKEAVFASSEFVLRGGSETCTKIFFMTDKTPLSRLVDFNRSNKGYLLVADYKYFSDVRDIASMMIGGVLRDMHLDYSHFNNASAIVVTGPEEANSSVKGHFDGALKETDVVGMFIVGHVSIARTTLFEKMGVEDVGSPIVKARFHVIANERERAGVVIYQP